MIHPEILFCSRITRVVCENMLHSPVVENHKVFRRLGEAQDIWEKGSNSSNSSPRHKRKAKKDAVFFFQTWPFWYLVKPESWSILSPTLPHVLWKNCAKINVVCHHGTSYFIRIRNCPENYIRKEFAPKKCAQGTWMMNHPMVSSQW